MPLITGRQLTAEEYEAMRPPCTCAITGIQKCPRHKICLKCHHQVCENCGDWCDTVLMDKDQPGNHSHVEDPNDPDEYPTACCDGECTYE